MKLSKIDCGKKPIFRGFPFLYRKKGSRIAIGDRVIVKSSFLSNLVGLYCRTIICTRTAEATIEIGDNVGISGAVLYARKGITVGDNTCIGANTKILDNDFHPSDWETRNRLMLEKRGADDNALVPAEEIKIGKNCMIGCNAIILKGSVLSDGCVVGAGAVVCGVFEENSLIAGNPARVIRKLL